MSQHRVEAVFEFAAGEGRAGVARQDCLHRPGAAGCDMAEHGVFAGGQHGSHPPTFDPQCGVSDRVHAAMHEVQARTPETAVDRLGTEAEGRELASSDDAVLGAGEGGDLAVDGALTSHIST